MRPNEPAPLIRQVEVLEDGARTLATMSIWEESPESPDEVKLHLEVGSEIFESKSKRGYFHALCDLRIRLEACDLFVVCYGASKNVYPSPMIEAMGGGEKAYKLTLGEPALVRDLVSIFDCGEDVAPSTVAQQREFYILWLESLR